MIFRPCLNRPPSPQQLEHWLYESQNQKKTILFKYQERNSKVELHCNTDLSGYIEGGASQEAPYPPCPENRSTFWVEQKKGPLLPIKRPSQFEDRVNKQRIYPLNALLPILASLPNAGIEFRITPMPARLGKKFLKKAQMPWFNPERVWDQWESKAWNNIKIRRLIGPIVRQALTQVQFRAKKEEAHTESSHEREDAKRAVLDKLSRPLFNVEIRCSHDFEAFFRGFNLPYLGELKLARKPSKLLLSAEELASLMAIPCGDLSSAYLEVETSAALPCPLAYPLAREEEDRQRHLYIIGKTGMGKSSCLLKLLEEDLKTPRAICVIDPHGDLIQDIFKILPQAAHERVVLLDPSCLEYPMALNPLECRDIAPHLGASSLLEMFKVLSQGSWGPRLEYILRNALLSLCLIPNTSLLDLPLLLTQKDWYFNHKGQLPDLELRRFWEEEFFAQNEKTRQEFSAPILNKVGPLLTSPLLRNMFSQPKNKLRIDHLMDENAIILIPLSKGKLGEDVSRMLGMIFIAEIQHALLRRANRPKEERGLLSLMIDEFQNFATPTLCGMLSESRKYGLALVIVNQYLTQLPLELQEAVLGNIGSLICFRASQADAEKLAPLLKVEPEDITQLSPFQTYMKLLYKSQTLTTFRWHLEAPKENNLQFSESHMDLILHKSRTTCGRPRQIVEAHLQKRYNKAQKRQNIPP